MKRFQSYGFIDSVIQRVSRNVEAKIRNTMKLQETQEEVIAA